MECAHVDRPWWTRVYWNGTRWDPFKAMNRLSQCLTLTDGVDYAAVSVGGSVQGSQISDSLPGQVVLWADNKSNLMLKYPVWSLPSPGEATCSGDCRQSAAYRHGCHKLLPNMSKTTS